MFMEDVFTGKINNSSVVKEFYNLFKIIHRSKEIIKEFEAYKDNLEFEEQTKINVKKINNIEKDIEMIKFISESEIEELTESVSYLINEILKVKKNEAEFILKKLYLYFRKDAPDSEADHLHDFAKNSKLFKADDYADQLVFEKINSIIRKIEKYGVSAEKHDENYQKYHDKIKDKIIELRAILNTPKNFITNKALSHLMQGLIEESISFYKNEHGDILCLKTNDIFLNYDELSGNNNELIGEYSDASESYR